MADLIYPLGLICGMLGIFILAQIVISYIWLRWLGAKVTTCPECGRKRAGELVESNEIENKSYIQWKDARDFFGRGSSKRQRIQISEKTYEDHFECRYCGHQWTTTAQEKTRGPV